MGDARLGASDTVSLKLTYSGQFSHGKGLYRSSAVQQISPAVKSELMLVTQLEKVGVLDLTDSSWDCLGAKSIDAALPRYSKNWYWLMETALWEVEASDH